MKRALAMALGAMMVAGSAAPASAASHIDFSGYYRTVFVSDTNNSFRSEPRAFTDSYFMDRLQIDLTFSPTDEISVYWRMRGPGSYQRWGETTGGTNLRTKFIYGEIKQDWGTVLVGRLSDDLDTAGLGALGYMPSTQPIWTNVGPFDRGDIMDGIRWTNTWDNGWTLLAQYSKLGNNADNLWDDGFRHSDQDWDRYQALVNYVWDGGGASLHVLYDRDAQYDGRFVDDDGVGVFDGYDSSLFSPYAGTFPTKQERWFVNPAVMHSWGDFSFHFEGIAGWGTQDFTQTSVWGKKAGSLDMSGYGAYLDFDYNYGPGNVTLSGWWTQGTDLGEGYGNIGGGWYAWDPSQWGKSKSLADIVGGNFYPLLVAYGGVAAGYSRYDVRGGVDGSPYPTAIASANNGFVNYVAEGYLTPGFLNTPVNMATGGVSWGQWEDMVGLDYGDMSVMSSKINLRSLNNDTNSNHWAIAFSGNHAFTDDISMHYAVGYLGLTQPNYRVVNSATYNSVGDVVRTFKTQDKDLGWELDLGFSFQLLDNLKFHTAFGYMFAGDAYKSQKGWTGYRAAGATSADNWGRQGDGMRAVWEDADDSYIWYNTLQFDF